jgi:subtilisin family serine protease
MEPVDVVTARATPYTGRGSKIGFVDLGFSTLDGAEDTDYANGVRIAGHGNRTVSIVHGYAGSIAPNAQIVRCLMPAQAEAPALAQAITRLTDIHCDIINVSMTCAQLGHGERVPALLLKAIQYANRRGSLIVAAIGNQDSFAASALCLPRSVVAVNATRAHGGLWFARQNNGPYRVDLVARGFQIKTMTQADQAMMSEGTSPATALVSGVLALLREKYAAQGILLRGGELKRTLITELLQKPNLYSPFWGAGELTIPNHFWS